MEALKKKNTIIIALVVTAAVVIVLIVAGFSAKDKDYEPSSWVLKSYGNSVALYNGNNIDTVFGEIVLDTLPEEDIRLLDNGIAFPTKKEAMQAVEDYDG